MEGAMAHLILALAGFQEEGGSQAAGLVAAVFGVGALAFTGALFLLLVVSMWKVFAKAGKPGWAAIVPIYNIVVMLEITGKPLWWIVLFFIPLVNFVAAILLSLALAEKFGKGAGFGIGIAFLSFVFLPILAFGDARYKA